MLVIKMDTREKKGKKEHILKYFYRKNITVERIKLNVGDYCIEGKEYVTIDLKRNLLELAQNLFSDSVRFEKECIHAKNNGVLLIFLIEQKIDTKQDLLKWHSPKDINGKRFLNVQGWQIYKEMQKYSTLFGCKFRFCHKNGTGKMIVDLLEKYTKQKQD